MAFNKMFVMLPVMLAVRRLDGEDPNIVYLLRCVYGAVQTCAVFVVILVYVKASSASALKENDVMIYVPPPPQPFADPNAKKTYQEKNLAAHVVSQARALVGSTLFGICMTVGLHVWKGMTIGLAMQSVMAPFNLMENPLVYAVLMGGGTLGGLRARKIFGEKARDEISDDDQVTDENGDAIVLKKGSQKASKKFEDVLLDTWDIGAEADTAPLLAALNATNINFKTADNAWTPIMIMAGLGAKNTSAAMKKMKALGADPSLVDKEGWNALHWAAFHGSAEAAKTLLNKKDFDGIALGLHKVADKEGKTPIMHAKEEGNDAVAKAIEMAERMASDNNNKSNEDGLRKRK